MSTHNIGFYEDFTKIIFELSSKTHLISSAENLEFIRQWLILQIKEALGCISVASWVNLLFLHM